MNRHPWDAAHVIYRDLGDSVDAVWVADPDIAHKLRTGDRDTYVRLFLSTSLNVELVGHLRRVYKRDGYTQGGWLLEAYGGPDYVGTRKPEAMARLREAAAAYFQPLRTNS